jgi:hypothetical protein
MHPRSRLGWLLVVQQLVQRSAQPSVHLSVPAALLRMPQSCSAAVGAFGAGVGVGVVAACGAWRFTTVVRAVVGETVSATVGTAIGGVVGVTFAAVVSAAVGAAFGVVVSTAVATASVLLAAQ